MLTGALLSVSRNTPMRVRSPTATVGIRGTGFYIEAQEDQTYFCTCYGATEVASNNDPESRENIVAKQHDRPVYIVNDGGKGKNIRNAPFIVTDLELADRDPGWLPPFVFPNESHRAASQLLAQQQAKKNGGLNARRFLFPARLLRRAVQDPVQERVIAGAGSLTWRIVGFAESRPQLTVVVISRRFPKQRAGNDIGEVDPAATSA
jgi:hypothetical protein